MPDNLPLFPRQQGVCLEYQGRKQFISFEDGKLASLTDVWRAAGSPENKEPNAWLRTEQAKGFVDHIIDAYNTSKNRIIKAVRGKGLTSGTFAHWQIALAYAKYLSHQFHEVVNAAFREWVEEKNDPALKVERAIEGFRKEGHSDDWIADRIPGIVQRKSMTSTMRDHNCRVVGDDNPYQEATTATYLGLFGKTARELKAEKNLPKNARTRNYLSRDQLVDVRFAESKAELLIKQKAADGNKECVKCVRDAVEVVKSANEAVQKLLNK